MIKLEYFATVLDFSDDNDFVYYIRNTISRLISDPSINNKKIKKVKIDANYSIEAYKARGESKLLQTFNDESAFSKQDREFIRKGTISQKISTLNKYLMKVDDLDCFVELASLLELLEEYVVYKPIDSLAEKLKRIIAIRKKPKTYDMKLNSNSGKENREAVLWIMKMLESFDTDDAIKEENSGISDSIKKSYESGDLDVTDIEQYVKVSNIILECYMRSNNLIPDKTEVLEL